VNAATRQAPSKGRPLSILIADDEQDTVMTLAAILEDEGHVVHTVTNGALVMAAVQRFKPEVCILDIEMPGESGYSLAQNIGETHKADRPVLIAITGKWKTQTDRLLAKAVGFDHFFLKPADPDALVAVLDQVRGPTRAA
jgi:DNA-binding response OmpR family regulator